MITDIEDTVSAISQVLDEAERISGAKISHVFASVSGSHILSEHARGVVAISKPTSEIDATDVGRVIDTAKTATLPQNRELLHLFPIRYLVDGQDVNRDPIGMSGTKLEVESVIISSSAPALRNLSRALAQAGLHPPELIFGPLATSRLLTSKKLRDSGVVVADIGHGSTDICVYDEGQIIHAASLPFGSTNFTKDLAIGLTTNLDIAEAIKIKYATALPEKVRDSEQINLSTLDPSELEKVPRKKVASIIEARATEMLQTIKEELVLVNRDGVLPAGIIFTGGGSELEGLTELSKKVLKLPSQLGYPQVNFSGIVDKIDSPVYSCAIGLILWGIEHSGDQSDRWKFELGKFGGVFNNIRGIFKNFTN